MTAILKTGQRVHVFVKNAIGWMQNALTDAMLEAKFHGMCDAVMGGSRCGALIDAAWGLGAAADVKALVGLAAGG